MFNGSWSFSSLLMYETCAFRFKLKRIDKSPEPPLEPGNPLERGNRVHDNYERFVKGEIDTLSDEPKQGAQFEALLNHARDLHAVDMAVAEDAWHFDADWNVVPGWDGTWVMGKLDLTVFDEDNGRVIVVDYKTGKSDYKTVEHIQQLQFYAALSALKYEWADKIDAELWYVDQGQVRIAGWNREEALRFVGMFDKRAQRIYDDKFFRPNPSKLTCRYCPYSPRGTGVCPVGV